MERKDPERDQARIQRIIKAEKSGDELVAALAQSSRYSRYDYTAYFSSPLFKVLNKVYGKEPFRLTRLEQLWNRELARAVAALVGPEYAEEIHEILKLRVEGQFSTAPWRHSYHSSDIGYYAYSMIDLICELIYSSCYPQSVEELLYYNNDHGCCGYEYRLALRIRRGDSKIIGLVREAVLGDGTQLMLSRNVIEAIIVSGDEELLEDLLRLLLAARLQEGLRQQVLESADKGSTKTLARIIKFCLDEDMFRYSSAMRAFGVWTGVGFDDVKPANVKKCAQYAYDCLVDEALRKEYLNSENNQRAYFALWAMGCHEIRDTELAAQKLLDDEKPYRRVLGWLFVYQSNSSAYKMHFARLHLDERDDEVLAWVLSCLPVTQQLLGSYYTATANNAWDNSPVKNELFPDNSAGRLELFSRLKEAVLYVGNRRRTFSGNPFDFVSVTLENTGLINCMMSLAGYDMHPGCIGQLLELQHLMNAEQRRALIIRFLKPETYVNHRAFLRSALSDRSIHVKELAVLRLSACELDSGDFAVLAESLRSKSSSLRKAVLSVFRSQSMEKLEPVIISMLGAKEEYQNQAAIELLLELREEQPHLMASCAGALGALKKRALSTQTTILLEQLGPKAKSEEYSLENGYGLYEPAVTAALAASVSSAAEAPKSGLVTKLLARKETQNGLLSTAGIKALFPSWEELDKVLERMNKVFECHADYEYEVNNWEGRAKILFGNPGRDFLLPSQYGLRTLGDKAARVEMLPFYDEFLKAMGQYAVKAEAYIGLRFVTNSLHNTWLDSFTETADWFKPHEKRWQGYEYERAGMAKYKLRYWQMLQFIQKAYQNFNANELYKAAMRVYSSLIAQFGESELGREFTQKKDDSRYRFYGQRREQRVIDHGTLKSMRSLIKSLKLSAEDFKDWFLQEYRWEKLAGGSVVLGLEMEDYLRACGDGVAPRDAFMEFVICSSNVRRNMGILTRAARWTESRELFEKYPWLTNAARDVVERILQTEERRGELTTELTEHARAIARFEGAEHFCNLLAALGKESFFRGYEYSGENTKKAVLSSLLKHCWPAPDDTPEALAALLKKTDISEKRLAEAVMYAP